MGLKDDQLVDADYEKKLRQVTIGFVGVFILSLIYVIAEGWGYFDQSLFYLIVVFIFSTVGFYLFMMREKILLILLSVAIAIMSLVFMSNSANWRQDYIKNGFSLEAHIESYPSYMEYMVNRLAGQPDLIGFGKECVDYSRLGKSSRDKEALPLVCRSANSVQETFGVDVMVLINNHFKKMKRTAISISKGEATQIAYPFCVNTKRCAYVPLLPPELTEEEVLNSTDSTIIRIRDGFWDLVEKDFITTNICINMDFCRYVTEEQILPMQQLIQSQQR